MVKVIIDTDPGVDDAMAILYAFADPRIELMGLTTIFGNVTIDMATRNALRLVELAGSDIPVAKGASKPLIQALKEPATFVHGDEGFGTIPAAEPKGKAITETAAEFICRMINEHPGEIALCPVGPLTNIALALDHDPSIVDKVHSVTVMGGSLEAGGNVNEFAEANIWQDPHAAQKVFSAGWPIKMIGLDVTHEIVCTREEFAELAQSAPKHGGFLNEAVQFYIDFHLEQERVPVAGCYMHDPSAVISIVEPESFSFDATPVDVIVSSDAAGQTARASEGPKVDVALKVDAQAVRKTFLSIVSTAQ